MITRITLKRLPLENLKRKPFRTAALTIVVAMLTRGLLWWFTAVHEP